MKCPFVIDPNEIERKFNRLIYYKTDDGEDYIFFNHDDGVGNLSNVQFCDLIGRKTDVFECLNENEWKHCRYYKSEMRWRKEKEERARIKEIIEIKGEKK